MFTQSASMTLSPQPGANAQTALQVRIHARRDEAQNVLSLDLRSVDGSPLPPFNAGAHVEVELPNGLSRSYSLVNTPLETHRYVIAVNRDRSSRGGSLFIHEQLRASDVLWISAPRNHFPLAEDAQCTVRFAGGIGVTPLYSMAQRLDVLQRPCELHYFARSRADAAFAEALVQLAARGHGSVHFHFDDAAGSPRQRAWTGRTRVEPDDDDLLLRLQKRHSGARSVARFFLCGSNTTPRSFSLSLKGLSMTRQRIAVIAGDGIGKEVIPEGVKAVNAAAARFDIELEFAEFNWSSDNYDRIGAWMPADWFA